MPIPRKIKIPKESTQPKATHKNCNKTIINKTLTKQLLCTKCTLCQENTESLSPKVGNTLGARGPAALGTRPHVVQSLTVR